MVVGSDLTRAGNLDADLLTGDDALSTGSFAAGLVVLFGSGETSTSGQKVFDWVLRRVAQPLRVAILETPAGFELNSAQVAGRIGDFLNKRLQNYKPQVTIVPARKRGTPFSPDDPLLARSVLDHNVIFLGPGSPTYAARQLRDSAVWHTVVARHRLGAALVLASAATIAASRWALPVYEIYKVGQDPHWQAGLDFFAPYGLNLVFIPHWNNNDGGSELDTGHCFMGRERFEPLAAVLPPETVVVGIDEHTALIIDLAAGKGRVMGRGGVTVLRHGTATTVRHNNSFSLTLLGDLRLPSPEADIPPDVWGEALAVWRASRLPSAPEPAAEVQALAAQRQQARERRDWAAADALRGQIEALGWRVQDTPAGQKLTPAW